MRRTTLALALLIGATGCATQSPNDTGICIGQRSDIARLRAALEAHPETPDAVGEAATDTVIGHEAACPHPSRAYPVHSPPPRG